MDKILISTTFQATKGSKRKLVVFTENQRNSYGIMSVGSAIYTTKCAVNYNKLRVHNDF